MYCTLCLINSHMDFLLVWTVDCSIYIALSLVRLYRLLPSLFFFTISLPLVHIFCKYICTCQEERAPTYMAASAVVAVHKGLA